MDDKGRSSVGASEQSQIRREDGSFLIASVFVGLGTGFIAFWLTLSIVYSATICAFGIPVVWFVARDVRKIQLTNQAMIVYFISALVGIGVGFASSFGTGMPVS